MRLRGARALLALVAACALAAAAPPQPLLAITLYEGGLARIDAFIPTNGSVSVAVPLLGQPDPSLGVLVVDEWGEPLAYAVNETLGFIFVASVNSSLVRASYYTQDLTSKAGAVWSLNFTSPYRVRVALPENATVTWLGRLPDSVYSRGSRLVLEFGPGLVSLKYVVLYAPPPANQTAPRPQPQQPSWWSQLLQPPLVYALAAAAAALAAAAIALAAKRGAELAPAELGEEDVRILDELRRLGGGALQSELQKAVGMPPTTLWRRVKRLERLGYVVVEKKAGRNYVRLA
jgi:uncharacterized membrane protein